MEKSGTPMIPTEFVKYYFKAQEARLGTTLALPLKEGVETLVAHLERQGVFILQDLAPKFMLEAERDNLVCWWPSQKMIAFRVDRTGELVAFLDGSVVRPEDVINLMKAINTTEREPSIMDRMEGCATCDVLHEHKHAVDPATEIKELSPLLLIEPAVETKAEIVAEIKDSSPPAIDEEEIECCICMDAPITTKVLPCNHLNYCWDCALKIAGSEICSICRGQVTTVERVSQ